MIFKKPSTPRLREKILILAIRMAVPSLGGKRIQKDSGYCLIFLPFLLREGSLLVLWVASAAAGVGLQFPHYWGQRGL
jgi:hypothetical protein